MGKVSSLQIDFSYVKNIIFDLDGVIVDSMKNHASSWKSVLEKYNIYIQDQDIYRREGMSGAQSIRDIFIEHDQPVPTDKMIKELIEEKSKLFESKSTYVYPLAEEIIEFIKMKEKSLALVTGSLLRSVKHVLSDRLLSSFDILVTADNVKKGKPHPEPYLKALTLLDSKKNEAIVIENAPMGILSAKSAGLHCLAIETTLRQEHLQNADAIFENHDELKKYLEHVLSS